MADPLPYLPLYEFISNPGVRRDGTELDSPFYADGVWMRFQRGKPRKMGGYRALSQLVNGPVRSTLIDSRNGVNSAHYFSQFGVQRQVFSSTGAGADIEDRTPLTFTPDASLTWSHGVMTSSTGGNYAALLAASAPDLDDISSDSTGLLYSGDIKSNAPLEVVSDGSGPIQVSGGVCILQPFAVVYGSNGLIQNSAANDFSAAGWAGQFSNSANPAGSKIVHGAPVRGGGQSPAGLFWSLDSLIRMSFVGGAGGTTPQWRYDILSSPTSVLSKKAIVEHDGKFFWPGTDRFLFYNGVVQELPNQMNLNWFYDNLNMQYRNKVWGTKIPRWGEIWWFYPRGTDTECGHAVIYNYREDTWYDAVRARSSGDAVTVFPFPIWCGAENTMSTMLLVTGVKLRTSGSTAIGSPTLTFADTTGAKVGMVVTGDGGIPAGTTVLAVLPTTITLSANATSIIASSAVLTFASMTSAFRPGDTVTGSTSTANGTAVRVTEIDLNLENVTGEFQIGETITGGASATATLQEGASAQQLDTAYQQEYGVDKVVDQEINAIVSSFTSKNFGYAVGAPFGDTPETKDLMTEVIHLEPDFSQVGELAIAVEGRSYAQNPNEVLQTFPCEEGQARVDMRQQQRILRVTVTSNTRGGFYQQGQVMMALGPGDQRSTEEN